MWYEKFSFLLTPVACAIILCFLFFVGYATLGIVIHEHYQSFGYDLGINDQVVWRYAHFQIPTDTIAPLPDKTKFAEHVELIFIIISPFYWLWSSPLVLIVLQAVIVCISALTVYLLARKYHLSSVVSIIVMIAYLTFYGVQFGLWTDVHSSVFAAAFLMLFIYFLDISQKKLSFLFFFLTLTAKESTGTALFFVSFIYFLTKKQKQALLYMLIALLYTAFIFFVFFPYIVHTSYLYANHKGLLSNLNPISLVDTSENRLAIFYSFASWGFLPFFSPLVLLPILSHFYKFFVIASDLSGAQGLFGQYRIMLTPILALGTIWTLKQWNSRVQAIAGVWLLITVLFVQYSLHLPLSYLTKQWFWRQPPSVISINTMIRNYLPPTASVVSQNNITPHISERDKIYTLYPEKKTFLKNSPCGQKTCDWFRWFARPDYLIVDTASDWDARHFLIDRPQFLAGLQNLQKKGVITVYKQIGTTILYSVHENPDPVK